jgi:DMSO/TMAO reductase YedYZ molybdopterin-dependent catalytic subunit
MQQTAWCSELGSRQKVGHRVHEDHARPVPPQRLVQPLGAQSQIEAAFVRMARHAPEALRFPIGDLDRLLLATRAGGAPLSVGHGFPARLVAPGRRGFWWIKWVDRIELRSTPWWWQPPFPVT